MNDMSRPCVLCYVSDIFHTFALNNWQTVLTQSTITRSSYHILSWQRIITPLGYFMTAVSCDNFKVNKIIACEAAREQKRRVRPVLNTWDKHLCNYLPADRRSIYIKRGVKTRLHKLPMHISLLSRFLCSIKNVFVFNQQSLTNLINRMILCYLDDVNKSFVNKFTRITKNQYPFPVYETRNYRRFSLQ